MLGPTPVSGKSRTIAEPVRAIASRSRLLGSRRSNIDIMRLVTLSGAKAKNSAATTGSSPSSRRSLRMNSTPTATHAPTHALRVSVSESATTSAGMTSAGQTRSRVPKTSRAPATPITSISVPE